MRIIVRPMPAELPVDPHLTVHYPQTWAFTTCGQVTIHDLAWRKLPGGELCTAMTEADDRHTWCPDCFGVDRCNRCGMPVLCNPPHRHNECLDCMRADTAADKQWARAS